MPLSGLKMPQSFYLQGFDGCTECWVFMPVCAFLSILPFRTVFYFIFLFCEKYMKKTFSEVKIKSIFVNITKFFRLYCIHKRIALEYLKITIYHILLSNAKPCKACTLHPGVTQLAFFLFFQQYRIIYQYCTPPASTQRTKQNPCCPASKSMTLLSSVSV